MNYRVVWKKDALKQLAEAWNAATDRQAVTTAADRVDSLLGRSPAELGESRSRSRRILFEPPLVLVFEILEGDKKVRVVHVRLRERPSPGG